MPVLSGTKRRLSPTVTYLLTALIISWPAMAAAAWALPFWRLGIVSSPASLIAIHAVVLGFLLTVAYGVLYQVVPIAFQAPPVPRHVMYWHLPLHVLAVSAMVLGFWRTQWLWVAGGGALCFLMVIAYAWFVGTSWRAARNRTVVHRWLMAPGSAVVIVMVLGIWQALHPAAARAHVLWIHAVVGGLGFWCGLIIVISYKFVPMFTLSHGYRVQPGGVAAAFFGAIALIAVAPLLPPIRLHASAWGDAPRLATGFGSLALAFACAWFVRDMSRILRARKRRQIVLPMRYVLAALTAGGMGIVLVVAAILLASAPWSVIGAYLLVFGGFMPMVLAYMQKIIPFLWFEYRFSQRPERRSAPLIDDMISHTASQLAMTLYYFGVAAGLAVLVGAPARITIPAAWEVIRFLFALFVISGTGVLFVVARRVLTIGGPRPID